MISSIKYYEFNKTNDIYLYARNNFSIHLYKELLDYGYRVKGIIDANANVYKDDSIVIGDLDVFCKTCSRLSIVIICLSNGLAHDEVANELVAKGFAKVVFLPMESNLPKMIQSDIRRAFRKIMMSAYDEIFYLPMIYTSRIDMGKIISIDGDYVSFYVNTNCLYTMGKKEYKKYTFPDGRYNEKVYANLEDEGFKLDKNEFPLRCLYRSFDGDETDLEEYFHIRAIDNKADRDNKIHSEKKLYDFFCDKWNTDRTFFEESPAMLEWNTKGYFNVFDGNHRCIFLMHKGNSFVPAYCSIADYNEYMKWKNEK